MTMIWPKFRMSAATIVVLLLAACAEQTQEIVPAEELSRGAVTNATPEAAPGPVVEPLELAYIGAGAVWLVRDDGRDRRRVLDAAPCHDPVVLSWSPGGDRLACEGVRSEPQTEDSAPLAHRTLTVFNPDGDVMLEAGPLSSFSWSPDGHRLAYGVLSERVRGAATTYYIADKDGARLKQLQGAEGAVEWSPDGSTMAYSAGAGRVHTYSVRTGEHRAYGPDLDRPLGWALDGRGLLVASRLRQPEVGFGEGYEALLLDLSNGERTRLPQLDNGRNFWISPDGWSVVFRSLPQPPGLTVLHLPMRAITPIAGSTISFPSHRIPDSHLAFSSDGEVVWLDPAHGLYQARIDGSGLAKAASAPSIFVRFSLDLTNIAYVRPGNPPTLWTANLDGSKPHEIGPVRNTFAWRPLATAGSDGMDEARSMLERFAAARIARDTATVSALLSEPLQQIFASGSSGIWGVRLGQVSSPCWYRYQVLAFDKRREPAGSVAVARLRMYQHFWPGDIAGGIPRSWEEDVRLAPTPRGWRITALGPAINDREEPDEPHGPNTSACNVARGAQ